MTYHIDHFRALCHLTSDFISQHTKLNDVVFLIQCYCRGAIALSSCRNKYIVEIACSHDQYMDTTIGKLIAENFDNPSVCWDSVFSTLFKQND